MLSSLFKGLPAKTKEFLVWITVKDASVSTEKQKLIIAQFEAMSITITVWMHK